MKTREEILSEVLAIEREKNTLYLKQRELYEEAKNISDIEDDKL